MTLSVVPNYENIIFIVAGSYWQAREFAKQHGIPPIYWDYVGAPGEVEGVKGSVVYCGSFYQRHDIAEIKQAIEANESLKVLDLDE